MAAALTIAVLFALSVTIVRVASVAMRLTGLPENVTRFQCVSTLTGTGFTTGESEMIVNYPIRRRILVALMVLGNLGLMSVAATFIVAFIRAGGDADAVAIQILTIIAAIGIILFLVTNKTLDRLMCGLIGFLLIKTTSLGQRRYQRILQLDNGFSIAEHVFIGERGQRLGDMSLRDIPLTLLIIRGKQTCQNERISDDFMVSPGDILVCYGSEKAHDAFETLMMQGDAARMSARAI